MLWANLTPFMPVLVLIMHVILWSTLHFAAARNMVYSVILEKNFETRKCQEYRTIYKMCGKIAPFNMTWP